MIPPIVGASANLRIQSQNEQQTIRWGYVKQVDPENQTMNVQLSGSDTIVTVPINNNVTQYGQGIRIMPVVDVTRVLVERTVFGSYYHIGYLLEGVGNFTDNITGNKPVTGHVLLQRYLEEGEVEIINSVNCELFLSKDGSVFIKSTFGDFIKLENYTSTIQMSSANLKAELDQVRIRAGNVKRPVNYNTTDDEHIVELDGELVKEEDVDVDKIDDATLIKEFSVQVGIVQDEDREYRDSLTSPPVAELHLSSKLINEEG